MKEGQRAAVQGEGFDLGACPAHAGAGEIEGAGSGDYDHLGGRDAPRQGGADAVAHGIAARQDADAAAPVLQELVESGAEGRRPGQACAAIAGDQGKMALSAGQQVGGVDQACGRRRKRRQARPRRCRRWTATLPHGMSCAGSDRQSVDGGGRHGAAAAPSAHGDEGDAARVGC